MIWITTFIDSSWQTFMEYPFRQLYTGECFWLMPMIFTGATGTPLPIVFALTAASLADPSSLGDFAVMYDPIAYSVETPETIIDSVDCNLGTSTEPYIDIGPLWLVGLSIFTTTVVMVGGGLCLGLY